ncbi:pilus assembly protein PilM [Candidatus Parcubacteria bacterium]|nr:pilus assembly protein PilM [Candidatus Parcubacteria bacterium]
MLNFFSRYSIGIDIIDSAIKGVCLKKSGKVINLEDYQEVFLSPGIIIGGEIKNQEKFIKQLSTLFKKIHNTRKRNGIIISSIPESKTFIKLIKAIDIGLLKSQKSDKFFQIPESILEEIKQNIPFEADDLYVDWQIVGGDKVLIGAAQKAIVDSYTDSFNQAGISLSCLDIKPAAVLRSVIDIKKNDLSSKIILNIGSAYSTVILGNNKMIEFTATFSFSDKIISQTISDNLKISDAQTQKAKKVCGFSGKKCKGAVKKVLQPCLEEVINYIEKAVSFHRENIANKMPINKIILCGENAIMPELDKLIDKKLKIKTIIADPLANISHTSDSRKKFLPYAAAIGMALRGVLQYDHS